jgi:repressor LexA
MTKTLTPEQRKVLSFIVHRQRTKGSPPTVREICNHFGYKSANNARQHMRLIEQKGYIRHVPGKSRGIEIVVGLEQASEASVNEVRVPLIGRIAAGVPITAEENCEGYIALDRTLFPSEGLFTLRVSGDSMINAGIFDGDLVIIRQQPIVENGEIAAVIIEGEATLKRFIKKSDYIILRAENPVYGDMVFFSKTEVWVVGKMVGLIRKS